MKKEAYQNSIRNKVMNFIESKGTGALVSRTEILQYIFALKGQTYTYAYRGQNSSAFSVTYKGGPYYCKPSPNDPRYLTHPEGSRKYILVTD